MTRHMVCAVMGAIMATVGWSQSLTLLDTRFNPFTVPLGVSADGSVVVGMSESFPQQSARSVGRGRLGHNTSAHWAATRAVPTASRRTGLWWSAGRTM